MPILDIEMASIVKENSVQHHKRMDELKKRVNSNAERWQDYQEEVNKLTEDIFKVCRKLESMELSREQLIYAKQLFIDEYRDFIRSGSINRLVMDKPFGYPGDFQIGEEIAKNQLATVGFECCADAYFLNSPATVSTRQRHKCFVTYIKQFIFSSPKSELHIMDFACGPCRVLAHLAQYYSGSPDKTVYYHCTDMDQRALEYAKSKTLMDAYAKFSIQLIQVHPIRFALNRNPHKFFKDKYDLIYSGGITNYLEDRVVIRFIANLKTLLKTDGRIMLSNYRKPSDNPSRLFMEWGVNWNMIYRSDEQYISLFEKAGFRTEALENRMISDLGIMQYCVAKKSV